MTERLLIQAQGSPRDPDYSEQKVWDGNEEPMEVPLFEYFHEKGIKTLEKDLVVSCHGNTELTLQIAQDIQKLADNGHKVVVIAQGGLYFALPSLIAANAPTVPVISIPLPNSHFGGLDSFLAPQVPSGTAAIGGVSVDNYETAVSTAVKILNNRFEGVYLFNKYKLKKLEEKLEEFGIPILGRADKSSSGLIVGELGSNYNVDFEKFDSAGLLGIFTPIKYCRDEALTFMRDCGKLSKSLYVRGQANVATFIAKIMAQYNERARNILKETAEKKAASYEQRRITIDSFIGGN